MKRSLASRIASASTRREHTLGATFTDENGNVWRYIVNAEASASLVIGSVVAQKATTGTAGQGVLAPTSAPTARLLGVAQYTIAAGSYGWVLVNGMGEVEAGTGAITANTSLVVDATDPGHATDAGGATEHAFGFATEAALAGALATCLVRC